MTREEIYSRFEELDKRASLGGGVDKIEKQHAQGKYRNVAGQRYVQ